MKFQPPGVHIPSPSSSESSEWTPERQRELVDRLSTKKEPTYTIDLEQLEAKALEECSHRPRVNMVPPAAPRKELPKDYLATVARIKKATESRRARREADERILLDAGVRLEKVRRRKSNPPSFLGRQTPERRREKKLLYVNVSVMPGKYLICVTRGIGRAGSESVRGTKSKKWRRASPGSTDSPRTCGGSCATSLTRA